MFRLISVVSDLKGFGECCMERRIKELKIIGINLSPFLIFRWYWIFTLTSLKLDDIMSFFVLRQVKRHFITRKIWSWFDTVGDMVKPFYILCYSEFIPKKITFRRVNIETGFPLSTFRSWWSNPYSTTKSIKIFKFFSLFKSFVDRSVILSLRGESIPGSESVMKGIESQLNWKEWSYEKSLYCFCYSIVCAFYGAILVTSIGSYGVDTKTSIFKNLLHFRIFEEFTSLIKSGRINQGWHHYQDKKH